LGVRLLKLRETLPQLIRQALVFERALIIPLGHDGVARSVCDSPVNQAGIELIGLYLEP
jgi:hypothetical protein